MKKLILSVLLSVFSMQLFALSLEVNTSNLNATDTFGIAFDLGKGKCSPKHPNKYNCQHTKFAANDFTAEKFKEFITIFSNVIENSDMFFELSFNVNDNNFASCQHLEKRGKDIAVTLTREGCI